MSGRGNPAAAKGRLHDRRTGVTAKVWQAIVKLRHEGHRVFVAERRNGCETHHAIDGDIVPTSWLVDLAGASQPRKEGVHV